MRKTSQLHVYRLQPTSNRAIKECVCVSCDATLGFSPNRRVLVVLRRLHDSHEASPKARAWRAAAGA